MSTPSFPHERWLYPVTLDATNNTFEVSEDGVVFRSVTLTPGDYYMTYSVGAGDGLLDELVTQINATAGLTPGYDVDPITPRATMGLGRIGIRITAPIVTPLTFRFPTSTGSTSRPTLAQMLGMEEGDNVGTLFDGEGILDSWGALAGVWIPGVRRTSYEPQPVGLVSYSTAYAERSGGYGLDRGRRRLRSVAYEYIPSTRVFFGRANLPEYAINAEEATGDTSNSFELMWRRLSAGDSIYVVHYGPSEEVDLSVPDVSYGAARAADQVVAENVEGAQVHSAIATMQVLGGELYRVGFDVATVASSYDY